MCTTFEPFAFHRFALSDEGDEASVNNWESFLLHPDFFTDLYGEPDWLVGPREHLPTPISKAEPMSNLDPAEIYPTEEYGDPPYFLFNALIDPVSFWLDQPVGKF